MLNLVGRRGKTMTDTDQKPDRIKSSFAPVADAATRVLILGSLPGEASLRQGRYYAHPRNQFWRLMEAVTGRGLVDQAYPERLAALGGAGVGLWDVIASARRAGSLDADIRDCQPNTLAEFAASLPALRTIGFNGAKAYQIGRRELIGKDRPVLIALPSSSPAHAALSFEGKREAWLRLKPFLQN
jgi:double-stranded uracil-DNA glycosylase